MSQLPACPVSAGDILAYRMLGFQIIDDHLLFCIKILLLFWYQSIDEILCWFQSIDSILCAACASLQTVIDWAILALLGK